MILLDTNALIRAFTDPDGLGAAARTAISTSRTHFSSVSTLEVMIKQLLGKLPPWPDLTTWLQRSGLRELPFTSAHAEAVAAFPQLVRHDPFDRMLLAQATVEGLRFLTSDVALLSLQHDWIVDARV